MSTLCIYMFYFDKCFSPVDLTLIITLLHLEFRSMEQPLHGLHQTENEVSMSVSTEKKGVFLVFYSSFISNILFIACLQ